ncbi:MAG: peptidylprolyl isomerase [Patescibacteria group bacterium]|nr:peptidylprolyl isomerase [Patescibacteria group bacterium]
MKKSLVLLTLILITVVFSGCTAQNSKPSSEQTPKKEIKSMSTFKFPGVLPDEKIKNKKAIVKTSKGTIELELYADKAPKTVSNFVYLAENKFYDSLTFHRVVPGFVIQGGDPNGTGTGGPGYQFEDEKVIGDYKAGTVAMANSGSNTNGSQFFICIEDQPSLPKLYNLFGQVLSGMDVVGKIQVGDKIESVTIENR